MSPLNPPACVAVASTEQLRSTSPGGLPADRRRLGRGSGGSELARKAPRTHPELSITADWRHLLDDPAIRGDWPRHRAGPPGGDCRSSAESREERVLRTSAGPLAPRSKRDTPHGCAPPPAAAWAWTMSLRRDVPNESFVARLYCFGAFWTAADGLAPEPPRPCPGDHWMWDTEKSGGILRAEHGVHFFDAYGQIAGAPEKIWANAPRKEAGAGDCAAVRTVRLVCTSTSSRGRRTSSAPTESCSWSTGYVEMNRLDPPGGARESEPAGSA